MADVSWRTQAACLHADPELFFPIGELYHPADTADAREVCRGCDVRQQCREFADDNLEKHGIWAGLTGPELEAARRKTRRRQRVAVNSVNNRGTEQG